ncbi:MAG: glycosyltransferase [Phyllobacterium sp.]
MLHILYLVHDLSDPAVRRRVMMLQAGGARVTLAGFRRADQPVSLVETLVPIDLGKTGDGKFAQRLAAIGRTALTLGARLKRIDKPDVIIGRNLEMLALAQRAKAVLSADIPVVYECLDIHRLLLRKDFAGKAIRAAERALGRNSQLLITSSPAFVRNYFEPFGQIDMPVELLENKVLEIGGATDGLPAVRALVSGEPWVIGWFGALRCRRSLELLAAFTRKMEGRARVVLRGRPAYGEFLGLDGGFDGFVAREPYLDFLGPYRNPEDLPRIYGEVHFSWAIDFFEEGMNSDWLLPNRLYEGCRYGVVPIAMEQTETGRLLGSLGIGHLLGRASVDEMMALFDDLDADRYEHALTAVASLDRGLWVCDARDCRALVDRLRNLSFGAPDAALTKFAA